jgi:hypothetical protein
LLVKGFSEYNIATELKVTVVTYVKDYEKNQFPITSYPVFRKVMSNAVLRSGHYSNSASCYLVEGKERLSIFRDPL